MKGAEWGLVQIRERGGVEREKAEEESSGRHGNNYMSEWGSLERKEKGFLFGFTKAGERRRRRIYQGRKKRKGLRKGNLKERTVLFGYKVEVSARIWQINKHVSRKLLISAEIIILIQHDSEVII